MAIIYTTNHSIKLTNILGDRSVPILVTLFLLSYTKLLQIIIASLGYTQIKEFGANGSRNRTVTVWSVDGNYAYCHYPRLALCCCCAGIPRCVATIHSGAILSTVASKDITP